MGEYDNSTIYFNKKMWESFLAEMGRAIELKGYVFAKELEDKNLFALIQSKEKDGSSVEVNSSDITLDAIGDLTDKYPRLHLISYHTHPITGPSAGDLNTFIEIYNEKYRNHILIGPSSVQIIRVFEDGTYKNLNDTGLLKIKKLNQEQEERYLREGNTIARDFHKMLKERSSSLNGVI